MLDLFMGAMLGCIFDSLDLILDVFSPLMPISLIFNGAIFVLSLSQSGGLILYTYIGV